MDKHRLRSGHHFRVEGKELRHYQTGDTFTPTARELEMFGDKLERVEVSRPPRRSRRSTKETELTAEQIVDMEVEDVIARISDASVDLLRDLLRLEGGKEAPRQAIVEAVERALAKLEEE